MTIDCLKCKWGRACVTEVSFLRTIKKPNKINWLCRLRRNVLFLEDDFCSFVFETSSCWSLSDVRVHPYSCRYEDGFIGLNRTSGWASRQDGRRVNREQNYLERLCYVTVTVFSNKNSESLYAFPTDLECIGYYGCPRLNLVVSLQGN